MSVQSGTLVRWTPITQSDLSSVRQLIDGNAEVILAQTHEPYGEVLSSAGEGESSYAYAGEWTDTTCLQYLRARYMNPALGRFTTRDTWAGDYNSPLSLNRWGYVQGNPVMFTDPSGYISLYQDQTIKADATGSFWRFDETISFIYNEMITNTKGSDANNMREWLRMAIGCNEYVPLMNGGCLLFASYTKFFSLVLPGGAWDHKPQLESMLSIHKVREKYFPIRGDDEFEYFFDIWSNIYYGYVGSSIGFDRNGLQDVANLEKLVPEGQKWKLLRDLVISLVGEYDPGDEISVEIGIELWFEYGDDLIIEDLHSAILNHKYAYLESQDTNGNGRTDNSEVDPRKGKLLPASHEWYDGE